MWDIWVQLVIISTVGVAYFLLTVVFCFWFVYLLDGMKRKIIFYKRTLKCGERESDSHQQMLAYNAKTDIVKFVFLFCLNLLEWVGVTFGIVSLILHFVREYIQEFPTNHSMSVLEEWDTKLNTPYIENVCIEISMAMIGSLCMYLSMRYAHKSWMKSNRIPCWICFFSLSSIAAQILVTICYTHIIGMWCDAILVTLSVVFAWKQYRKLDMVLQWSIVDLRVNGDIELFDRHVRMKRRFNRIFITIWIGISFILATECINVFSQTAQTLLGTFNHLFTDMLLCEFTVYSHRDSYVIMFLTLLQGILSITGCLFFFIPYVGYGLCTMYVLLWRLFRGKTGYKTHFHVQLNTPLMYQ